MPKNKYNLYSNNIFSVIFDFKTNIKEDDIKSIDNPTNVNNQNPQPTNNQNEKETNGVKWSEFIANNKNTQLSELKNNNISQNKFNLNGPLTDTVKYTLDNANARYSEITGQSIDPNRLFDSTWTQQEISFYQSTPQANGTATLIKDYVQLQSGLKKTINLSITCEELKDMKNWKTLTTDDIAKNKQKIEQFLNVDSMHRSKFRRVIRTIAAAVRHEVGGMGGRYLSDAAGKAKQMIEYGIVCWSIINTAIKGYQGKNNIFDILRSTSFLNQNLAPDDNSALYQKSGLKPDGVLDETEFTRFENIEINKYKNDQSGFGDSNFNHELFVMALFDGLICEELEGYTSWVHLSNSDVIPTLPAFVLPKDISKIKSNSADTYLDRFEKDVKGKIITNNARSHADSYVILEPGRPGNIGGINVVFTKNK